MCYSVSLSPSLHLSKKICSPAITCSISAQWLMTWLKLMFICFRVFFFFFNRIQLTALMGPLLKSCGQESISHLMATNYNYEQNTSKEYVRAMLLNTVLWIGSRHYKSVSPSELLHKEKKECPPPCFCTWVYAEFNMWVTAWSWQPPCLQHDLKKLVLESCLLWSNTDNALH